MRQETLFTLKVQGVFRAEGFIHDTTAPVSTITKFTDGTWVLKVGRMTIKDRFSVGYKFIEQSLESALNIKL